MLDFACMLRNYLIKSGATAKIEEVKDGFLNIFLSLSNSFVLMDYEVVIFFVGFKPALNDIFVLKVTFYNDLCLYFFIYYV